MLVGNGLNRNQWHCKDSEAKAEPVVKEKLAVGHREVNMSNKMI